MSDTTLDSVFKICKRLLFDEPFYGLILLNLNKQVTDKVPTTGVGLNGVNYQLYINPTFWNSLDEQKQRGLLIHELRHICFFHITDFKHLKDPELANIAKDIYINQDIPDELLPEGGCTLESFADLKLPAGQDTNFYYKALLQEKEAGCPNSQALSDLLEQGGGGSGEGNGEGDQESGGQGGSPVMGDNGKPVSMPNHQWEEIQEMSEVMQGILDRGFAEMVNQSVKEVEKSRGKIPFDVSHILEKIVEITPPKFNWRGYVRNFVGTSVKCFFKTTKRKRSNRFPEMPGLKRQDFSHILVAIDTSASVSNDELKEFMSEIHHIYRTGHDITLILCDTRIHNIVKYNPRLDIEIKGRGGTEFQPVIDYYRENLTRYSCLIYFTDGECPPPENARGNILWVMSTVSYLNEELPGKCIKLEM
jgi:predicted metal-dependent peptidase